MKDAYKERIALLEDALKYEQEKCNKMQRFIKYLITVIIDNDVKISIPIDLFC